MPPKETKENEMALTQAVLDELIKAADTSNKELQFQETGNIGFDFALSNGKGMPLGCSILLWAAPGSGKTTLLGDVSRRLIKSAKLKGEPYKVLYLAVEGSRELMSNLGLDEYIASKDFIYIEKSFKWRQIEQFYEAVLQKKPPFDDVKAIIIDSVNNVLSDQNVKNSIADGDYGTKAKERGNFYSKYLPRCKTAGITSFFVAQIRQKQDAMMFGEKKKAAVSDADLHNVDIILKCSATSNSTDASKIEVETVFGKKKVLKRYIMSLDSSASSCKNRITMAYPSEVMIEKGSGIINYYALRRILEANKFLKKAGARYEFETSIREELGLPEGKFYVKDLADPITEKTPDIVNFLKARNCYSMEIAGKQYREITADDEDFLDEEEVEE